MRDVFQFADHLVIGGGPAGAMVALRLAASGRQVLLLEKEAGPHHKVCGEFLSREAVEYLKQAGVDPLALGGTVIRNLRLSSGDRVVETKLPFEAVSLSRRVLDEALLRRAVEMGGRVICGIAVETLAKDESSWLVALGSGACVRAKTVFLATGKHNLRGFTRAPARQADLIGFKLHWQLARQKIEELRGRMELFLFAGGYGGLALVEDDAANLCLVVRRSTLRDRGAWPELLAAILDENSRIRSILKGGRSLWPRPLAISPIPYGYVAGDARGPWCVGDQAAVIPSFTGDGISIALHSGALAAQMFLAGESTAAYQRALEKQLRRSMLLATRLSQAAVTRHGRAIALPLLSLIPRAMQWIAAATRIPHAAFVQGEDALLKSFAATELPTPLSPQPATKIEPVILSEVRRGGRSRRTCI
jgi:menaquinone-9 beta-reductase